MSSADGFPLAPPLPEAGPRNGAVSAFGRRHRAGLAPDAVAWLLPEEEPVALVYNRRTFAVMLASPADLEDFAIGFSLAEGIVAAASEIADLTLVRLDAGLAVRMTIPSARAAALVGRRRALEGRSGCGLCGIESLEELATPPPPVRAVAVEPAAIVAAFAALGDHQPMRARTHSVHAAAWCSPSGEIVLSREDVGRHSAFDKLIGAVARLNLGFEDGFALLSSRGGVELVRKAAHVGIGLLATVSAPTGLALATAARAGMTLAVATREGGVVLFDPASGVSPAR